MVRLDQNRAQTQLAKKANVDLTAVKDIFIYGNHSPTMFPAFAHATINGQPAAVDVRPGCFATVERAWKAGDVAQLEMPMEITLVEGHPRIEEVRNQVAIKRGPVVYCIESPDLPEGTAITDVYLKGDTPLKVEHRPDFLGGVCVVTGEILLRTDHEEGMYRTVGQPAWERHQATFVPYFSWSNRGPAEMSVFVPVIWGNAV